MIEAQARGDDAAFDVIGDACAKVRRNLACAMGIMGMVEEDTSSYEC
jgi:hypothetical protein